MIIYLFFFFNNRIVNNLYDVKIISTAHHKMTKYVRMDILCIEKISQANFILFQLNVTGFS